MTTQLIGGGVSLLDGLSISGPTTLSQTPNVTTAQSMVQLNTTNGYGSTNTMIRRFTNVVTNQGADIAYADSATLGASFTINTSGVYGITYCDSFSATAYAGISLNSNQLTTAVFNITVANLLVLATSSAGTNSATCATTIYLPAGSIIRPHADSTTTGNAARGLFTITRVS